MPRIAELLVEIGAKTDKLQSGLNSAENKVTNFGKGIQRLGGLIAGAFAVSKVSAFALEVSNLAGEAEGVENAFKRIADQKYLEELRRSTRGTVSDLELMRKTVSASNLGLPVQQLGQLFQFASRRAQDTGESVDYLVNSIVTGIGRKSPLILDNLGISAVRLRKALGGAGLEASSTFDVANAVAKIAQEEIAKMGDEIITSKDKTEQWKAEVENMKIALGDIANVFKDRIIPSIVTATSEFGKFAKAVGYVAKTNSELEKEEAYIQASTQANKTFLGGLRNRAKVWRDEVLREMERVTREEEKLRKLESLRQPPAIPMDKPIKEAIKFKKSLEDIRDVHVDDFNISQMYEPEREIQFPDDADLSQLPLNTLEYYNQQLERHNENLQTLTIGSEEYIKTQERIAQLQELVSGKVDDTNKSFISLGNTFASVWYDAISGAETFSEALKESIRGSIKALIAEGLTAVMAKAFETYPPPASIAIATGAAAVAGGLMAGVSRFAEGGMVTSPTMALVGDNPSGKEAIIPFEKMGMFLDKYGGGGGRVEFEIKGDRLYGVLQKHNTYRNRVGIG